MSWLSFYCSNRAVATNEWYTAPSFPMIDRASLFKYCTSHNFNLVFPTAYRLRFNRNIHSESIITDIYHNQYSLLSSALFQHYSRLNTQSSLFLLCFLSFTLAFFRELFLNDVWKFGRLSSTLAFFSHDNFILFAIKSMPCQILHIHNDDEWIIKYAKWKWIELFDYFLQIVLVHEIFCMHVANYIAHFGMNPIEVTTCNHNRSYARFFFNLIFYWSELCLFHELHLRFMHRFLWMNDGKRLAGILWMKRISLKLEFLGYGDCLF